MIHCDNLIEKKGVQTLLLRDEVQSVERIGVKKSSQLIFVLESPLAGLLDPACL